MAESKIKQKALAAIRTIVQAAKDLTEAEAAYLKQKRKRKPERKD